MSSDLVKALLLGRLVAFMMVVYIGFGTLVEWKSREEGSKLRTFGRLLCRPLTAPMAALFPAGTPYATILKRTSLAALAVWVAFILASELLLYRG